MKILSHACAPPCSWPQRWRKLTSSNAYGSGKGAVSRLGVFGVPVGLATLVAVSLLHCLA